jgi:hypothetical protein
MLPLPNWNTPTANVPPIQQQQQFNPQQNRFPNQQQHFNPQQNQQQRNFNPQQNHFYQQRNQPHFNPNQQQHFNPQQNQQQRNFIPQQQRNFNTNFIPQQQSINFMNNQLPTSFGPQNPGKRQYNNGNNSNFNNNNRGNKRGRGNNNNNFGGGNRGGHSHNSGGGGGRLFKDDFLQDPWTKLLNQQNGETKKVDSMAANEQDSTLSKSSQISDSNISTNHEEINIESEGDDNVDSYEDEKSNVHSEQKNEENVTQI